MRKRRPALFRGRHFAEEIMAERNLSVDHTTVWRWLQRYAPELSQRVRRELKRTGGSWRVDETYVRIAGQWRYLYRAVDSTGATIDFYLAEQRDAAAAKQFFRKALAATHHPRPRVVAELRQEHKLGPHCRCRTCPYLNNIIEQDHRAVKRRVNAKQGFWSFDGAWRTIQGYEAMHMIRKGQLRWLLKGDVAGQVLFIHQILGLKAT